MEEICSTVTSVNGVASPSFPMQAQNLPMRHSMRWPMVIREGIACGLTMMSGVIPSAVKGMSSWE